MTKSCTPKWICRAVLEDGECLLNNVDACVAVRPHEGVPHYVEGAVGVDDPAILRCVHWCETAGHYKKERKRGRIGRQDHLYYSCIEIPPDLDVEPLIKAFILRSRIGKGGRIPRDPYDLSG